MNNAKPKRRSKTLWFNGLTTAAALITAVAGFVPPPWMVYILAAQGAINFGLRLTTTRPLE